MTVRKIRESLKEKNIDAIFLVNDSNIRYVSGYSGSDSFVLLLQDIGYFITDYRYTEQAEAECRDFRVITVNREEETHEQVIASLIEKNGVGRLAFEENHASYERIENLKKAMNDNQSDTRLLPGNGIVEDFRYTKNEEEISHIRKGAEISDRVFDGMLGFLKPGISERDAAFEVERLIRKHGGDGPAFPVILLTGPNTSKPHGIPSDATIKAGDFITMDFGTLYRGYRSDMTRTVVMGKPDEKQVKVYNLVKEAQETGVFASKPGTPGTRIDQQVKQILLKHDYLCFAGKGVGHGLGLDIHEKPFINARCDDTLKAGCVITMEPGIYIPFWGGVRIEDTLAITEDGHDILTRSPKHLIRI